jgi:hypothetical protein
MAAAYKKKGRQVRTCRNICGIHIYFGIVDRQKQKAASCNRYRYPLNTGMDERYT